MTRIDGAEEHGFGTDKQPAFGNSSEYTDTEGLAAATHTSKSFWEKRRVRGGKETPPFITCGAKVLYKWSDVHAWLADRKHGSTSAAGTTRPPRRPKGTESIPAHAGA
jgi:hypothetical protein